MTRHFYTTPSQCSGTHNWDPFFPNSIMKIVSMTLTSWIIEKKGVERCVEYHLPHNILGEDRKNSKFRHIQIISMEDVQKTSHCVDTGRCPPIVVGIGRYSWFGEFSWRRGQAWKSKQIWTHDNISAKSDYRRQAGTSWRVSLFFNPHRHSDR